MPDGMVKDRNSLDPGETRVWNTGFRECKTATDNGGQQVWWELAMDVFLLRDRVIHDYAEYVRSFVQIREPRLQDYVTQRLTDEALWPQPLIQMNPSFEPGGWIDDLVRQRTLHDECQRIFKIKSAEDPLGAAMRLHRHQVDAIEAAGRDVNYVLTTGTGSGKSLSYIIPIVNHVLRHGRGKGIQAIVVYPMNALCNSQYGELEKFLRVGYSKGNEPVRFDRYTGQESRERRDEIAKSPPDILLTNYVMLELLLTRPFERALVNAAQGLKFLVLDELHTYRGRQGADVALLVRRVREACRAKDMLCVGTSATMASGGSYAEQRAKIADVASRLFGAEVTPENVIGETLSRATDEQHFTQPATIEALGLQIDADVIPKSFAEFIAAPMASWLESCFGLRRDQESGRLIRQTPQPITGEFGAAYKLKELTGRDESICELGIRRWLLGGYACDPHPDTGVRPFAFRLHQFISRGDAAYASLEENNERHLSLSGQNSSRVNGTNYCCPSPSAGNAVRSITRCGSRPMWGRAAPCSRLATSPIVLTPMKTARPVSCTATRRIPGPRILMKCSAGFRKTGWKPLATGRAYDQRCAMSSRRSS